MPGPSVSFLSQTLEVKQGKEVWRVLNPHFTVEDTTTQEVTCLLAPSPPAPTWQSACKPRAEALPWGLLPGRGRWHGPAAWPHPLPPAAGFPGRILKHLCGGGQLWKQALSQASLWLPDLTHTAAPPAGRRPRTRKAALPSKENHGLPHRPPSRPASPGRCLSQPPCSLDRFPMPLVPPPARE